MFYEYGLTLSEINVLFYMIETMDLNMEFFVPASQKHISAALNMNAGSVSLHIKRLIEKGIIEKGTKFGTNNTYKLLILLPCPERKFSE